MRVTTFITDTAPGVVAGQLAGLELRHRRHARVEDRIRELKATGLRNFPCQPFDSNGAWLEIASAAADLVAWSQLIGFTEHSELAGLRSTRSATGSCMWRLASLAAPANYGLRIDATWRWATPIAAAWQNTVGPRSDNSSTTWPSHHERPTGSGKARSIWRHGPTPTRSTQETRPPTRTAPRPATTTTTRVQNRRH